MAMMFCVGTYSASAMKGFVANPPQDRKEIVKAMSASTGIELIDAAGPRRLRFRFCG